MSILDRILDAKRREVAGRREERALEELERAASKAPPVRSLYGALAARRETPAVIAEVKRASPSKGLIREDFHPVEIARGYERGGAAAISVLTDEEFFQGSLSILEEIRREISLPVLRKDFVIDPYQVWESRAAGADALLLIVAALDDSGLRGLSGLAQDLGLEVLWEVHDVEEARRLAPFEPRLVGINNRDLRTFRVSLETTRRILPELPRGAFAVSESGFATRGELAELRSWGAGAFLIGESLMRAPDPGRALAELIGEEAGP